MIDEVNLVQSNHDSVSLFLKWLNDQDGPLIMY